MKLAYAILAAGKGTRMKDLTKSRNKCMLKYKGQPIISYIVDGMIAAGAEEIALTVNHAKEELIEFLTLRYPEIKFTFIEENLEGTGRSIDHLKVVGADYFFVMMGDQIFDKSEIIRFIENFKKDPANYIMSREVEDPRKYGVLEIESDRITRIIEKPENPPSNLINLAVYIFGKSIFDFTSELKPSVRGEYEITDAIQASINSGNIFRFHNYTDLYLDFTKPEDLDQ